MEQSDASVSSLNLLTSMDKDFLAINLDKVLKYTFLCQAHESLTQYLISTKAYGNVEYEVVTIRTTCQCATMAYGQSLHLWAFQKCHHLHAQIAK